MEQGVGAKFVQKDFLTLELLNTGDNLLVDCNAYESFWSNGLRISDKVAHDVSKWKGRNSLGIILCSVRNSLKY